MQFFVPTLEHVSKIGIEGDGRTDGCTTAALSGMGQQQANVSSRIQGLVDYRGGCGSGTRSLP